MGPAEEVHLLPDFETGLVYRIISGPEALCPWRWGEGEGAKRKQEAGIESKCAGKESMEAGIECMEAGVESKQPTGLMDTIYHIHWTTYGIPCRRNSRGREGGKEGWGETERKRRTGYIVEGVQEEPL